MHVHIATSGQSEEPILKCVHAIPKPIDKIYLLSGRRFHETAEHVQKHFKEGFIDCEVIEVDGFNFNEIVDSIYYIYDHEYTKNIEFSFNITGGTNLMTAAACSTAFMIGAKIYYLLRDPERPDQPLDERLVEISAPSMPDVGKLTEKQKNLLQWIIEMDEKGESVTNSDVSARLNISRPSATSLLRPLKSLGFIEPDIDGDKDCRFTHYILTKEGRLAAKYCDDRIR